jgi:hypothetical protein
MQTGVMFFPKELWDVWRRRLRPQVWCLFTVLMEETYGQGKVSADITIQQFLNETTLSEQQVQRALDKLCAAGIPMKVSRGPNGGTFSFEDGVRNGTLPEPRPREFEEVR